MVNMSQVVAQEAENIIPDVRICDFQMNRDGKYLTVEMDLNLKALNVDANRAVVITPRLVNGADSLDLPSVGVYGRRRYYYYERNGVGAITGESENAYRASRKPDNISYSNPVVYEDWMDGAILKLRRSDWGCCQEVIAEYDVLLGKHTEAFFPELVFVRPDAVAVKSRSLSGRAFVDFPVNKTEILPDYRRNAVELGKIQATIDSVRGDRDVSIVGVWLKGYASPDSPYSHNRNLAMGRTWSLKEYIQRLYSFASSVINTAYEPEDWEGLRLYVEQSDINHRAEILAIIDSAMEPDAKETKIKKSYPKEYTFLLQNCYPALRHTDYRIDYNIRSYSDVEEIKRIMMSQPQKLSLNEFYLVANTYSPGTKEFTDVFETAVRMYPDDEAANLNAANAAMRHGDHEAAHRYLAKAGGSAEAVYSRGALAIREKDYATARRYLQKAKDMRLEQAGKTLDELSSRTDRE